MQTLKFTFWKDEDYFIGFLNDYPDYMTQGVTKEELIENLRELLRDINSNEIPYIRRVEEMAVSS
jgi:hypothetical protein